VSCCCFCRRTNCEDAAARIKALLATAGFHAEPIVPANAAKEKKDASDAISVASDASSVNKKTAPVGGFAAIR
jgi:hypothetical protein